MADGESIVWAGLTAAEASKIAESAFVLAAWLGRPQEPGDVPETAAQFCESVVQTFEALMANHAELAGHGFLTAGYGKGVAAGLAEVPWGWRPAYASGLFGGRSEAQGGGEAPLQSGARIE